MGVKDEDIRLTFVAGGVKATYRPNELSAIAATQERAIAELKKMLEGY